MRSQFLTLLCVLTFLSCALGLADSVISYGQSQSVAETAYIKRKSTPQETPKQSKQYFEDRGPTGDQPIPGNPDEIQRLSIAQFIYSLITLIGAILMFQLRKIGFWIYVAGVLIGFVLPVTLVGFSALNTSFGVFFSLLFTGLYWLNINDMH